MEYPKFVQDAINQARVVNREELEKILNDKIEQAKKEEPRYRDFFVKRAIEEKEEKLKQYDNGENVIWHTDYTHEGYGSWGEDFVTDLYCDGSYKVVRHLAD